MSFGQSPHVGIDIRDMLRRSGNASMFADSLTKNTAPTFRGASSVVSRPTSRPTDISFEADVEREARIRVEHGRRAAQREAYLAAGAGSSGPPSNFSQVMANRHPSGGSRGGSSFGGSFGGTLAGGGSECTLAFPDAQPMRASMRAVPAGRGLSREGAAAREAAAANARSGSGDALNLSGVALAAGALTLSERSAHPPPRGRAGPSGTWALSNDGDGGTSPELRPETPIIWDDPRKRAPVDIADIEPSSPGGGGPTVAGAPTRMARAREWTTEVENQYRLQEAGYRDETEALSLGHPPVERWPEQGFIRKLITRETVGKESQSMLYFSKKRECEDKDLNRVKLYSYA